MGRSKSTWLHMLLWIAHLLVITNNPIYYSSVAAENRQSDLPGNNCTAPKFAITLEQGESEGSQGRKLRRKKSQHGALWLWMMCVTNETYWGQSVFWGGFLPGKAELFPSWSFPKAIHGVWLPGHEVMDVLAYWLIFWRKEGLVDLGCAKQLKLSPGFRWNFSIEVNGKAPDNRSRNVLTQQHPGKFSPGVDQILLLFMQS